jgi:hypothetical protein
MDLSEIKQKVQGKSPLMDAILNDPKFVEVSKIMACHDNNVPARINGDIKKITCYNYDYDFFVSAIRFNFDVSEWEGEYDTIIDIDVEILK